MAKCFKPFLSMLSNSIGADDLQLAVAIKQGNQQSLGILYDKYAPALSGIISRITNKKTLAEEILNSTFMKAWNQMAAFNPSNSSLFSWLITIARQTAFEAVKSDLIKNPKGANPVYDAHQSGLYNKSAFELVYYKGFTYIEAATELQLTIAEIRANIKMTMENMKENTEAQ